MDVKKLEKDSMGMEKVELYKEDVFKYYAAEKYMIKDEEILTN